MLQILIIRDNIIECGEVCWSTSCVRAIVPKRDPDKTDGKVRFWDILPGKLEVFVNHVISVLEKNNTGRKALEELLGFFLLSGIMLRFANDGSVKYVLAMSNDVFKIGDRI